MALLGYGEDALTLWAMIKKLDVVLHLFNDSSDPSKAHVLFRPSFGRAGGERSPQFGEFDFIILSEQAIYLGESKWDRSSEEISLSGELLMRPEQSIRHALFRRYIFHWMSRPFRNWADFVQSATPVFIREGFTKPVAPVDSLLASNLQTVLRIVDRFYKAPPRVIDTLIYFYDSRTRRRGIPTKCADFRVVTLDYAADSVENFVRL